MRFRHRYFTACYVYGLMLILIGMLSGTWWWPLLVIPAWELMLWVWKRDLES